MYEEPISWRVWWQDFTYHRFGTSKPDSHFKDFRTLDEANKFADDQRSVMGDGLVITVAPTPSPNARNPRKHAFSDLPKMRKRLAT